MPLSEREKKELREFYKIVGQNIHDYRIRNNISQERLAGFLGFASRISIANIESAKQNVQLHTIYKIASYLKIPISDLLPKPATREISKTIRKEIEKKVDSSSSEKLMDFFKLVTANK